MSLDLVLPDFLLFEGVSIEGLGGAVAGGIAAAGKTLGLEGALKELAAEVSAEEVKIDLAADVPFEFDKADLEPARRRSSIIYSPSSIRGARRALRSKATPMCVVKTATTSNYPNAAPM